MDILLTYFIFSVGFNLILFLIAYLLQTDKITDLSYSLTFMAIAVYSFINSNQTFIDIALLSLVIIWALRLGGYLAIRIFYMSRDKRFDEIRKNFLSFLTFWLMQGLTCFVVMIPVILANQSDLQSTSIFIWVGIAIALIGLIIESIADYQKFVFKKNNPDAFMSNGLWSVVQHPNYSGELMFWWGIFIICTPISTWYISIIGPIWISLIIIKFSGISILQKRWKKEYGSNPKFQRYHESTSKLIPFVY